MRGSSAALCAVLAVLAASCVAPAYALEPGVHIDPGSPAEKEYVLPLNQARQTGAPANHGGSGETKLFGTGITPPRSGGGGGSPSTGPASSGPATHTASKAIRPRHTGSGAATTSSPATPGSLPAPLPAAVLRAARAQGSSGNGSLLALIGGGLAILVIGGFGGTVLRHSRRPAPSER